MTADAPDRPAGPQGGHAQLRAERETPATLRDQGDSGEVPVLRRPLTAPTIAALQRHVGNRAVQAALRRGGAGSPEPVAQRATDGSQAAINARADAVAGNARKLAAEHEGEPAPPPDPGAKARARGQQQGNFAQPDKVSAPAAQVHSAAAETRSEVAAPAEPVVGGKSAEQPAGADHGPAGEAAAAAATGQAQAAAAQAQAAALPAPAAPPELAPPQVVDPVDSTGAPLPVSPAGDVAAGLVATRLAHLRHGAHALAVDATSHRARAAGLRGALAEARGKIAEAAGSIGTVKGHVAHRRSVTEQAASALDTSKQKAATVASEAPGIAAKAESGQQQTGPMATESAGLAGTAAGAAPNDAEAAAKAQQQTGQIRQVSGNLATIDSAVSQTGTRAHQLQADAEQAKTQNAASEGTIGSTRERLAATDAKLGELTSMNDAARGRVEGLAGEPGEIDAGAAAQQERADAVLASTVALEGRLHAVQEGYRTELTGLPGPPPRRGARLLAAFAAGPGGAPGPVAQRQEEPGARERFPSFDEAAAVISGDEQSAQQRAAAAAAAQRRQQQELATINEACGGDFSKLGAGDKASLALKLTFSRTFGSLGETNWPKFGLGILRGFVDPRVSLAGVVQGLGTILSGGANLLSAEQWRRDPLGNLLKSSADIATGVTVVLGSIAGLAVAIIAISAALILISWGTLAPLLLPVISVCSTVAATVGPWAITAAEIALALNALVFIKNLVDAATASTAAELQRESMAMGEDVNAMGMMAMQIAGDKIGKAVGPRIGGALEGVQSRLAGSGTSAGTMLAQNMTKIGEAMARGQARADAWAGRDVPAAPGTQAETPAGTGAGTEGPAPAAAPEPAAAAPAETPAAPAETPAAPAETLAAPAETPAAPAAAPAEAGPVSSGPGETPPAAPASEQAPPAAGAANDNAVPQSGGEQAAPAASEPIELTELPPELQGGQPANDVGPLGPEANEQVLAATGTDDVVPIGEQPKLTVIEGGATDPNAPRATAGGQGEPGAPAPGPGVTEPAPAAGPHEPTPAAGPHEPGPVGGPEPDAHAGGSEPPAPSELTPEQELKKLMAEQQADAAQDVGLTDVEPGAENVLDLPEYQSSIEAASEAFERLPDIENSKNVAGTPGGEPGTSGWEGEKIGPTEQAGVEGAQAGHETEPHPFDPENSPGQYENSHSERHKAAGTSDQHFASSKPMCPACQRWFGARAQAEGRPQFVADPTGVHVFMPDGRHVVTPHPSGAVTMP